MSINRNLSQRHSDVKAETKTISKSEHFFSISLNLVRDILGSRSKGSDMFHLPALYPWVLCSSVSMQEWCSGGCHPVVTAVWLNKLHNMITSVANSNCYIPVTQPTALKQWREREHSANQMIVIGSINSLILSAVRLWRQFYLMSSIV